MKIKTGVGIFLLVISVILIGAFPEPDVAFALGPLPQKHTFSEYLPLFATIAILFILGIILVTQKEKG